VFTEEQIKTMDLRTVQKEIDLIFQLDFYGAYPDQIDVIGRYETVLRRRVKQLQNVRPVTEFLEDIPEVVKKKESAEEECHVTILPDGRMDIKSAALYTGRSENSLAQMRWKGTGPEFVKRGKIFYFKKDLDAFMKGKPIKGLDDYVKKAKQHKPRDSKVTWERHTTQSVSYGKGPAYQTEFYCYCPVEESNPSARILIKRALRDFWIDGRGESWKARVFEKVWMHESDMTTRQLNAARRLY